MKEKQNAGLLLIGVGTHLSSMTAVGFLLGYATDQWLESTPIFMLSFGILGFIGGVLKAHKMLTKLY